MAVSSHRADKHRARKADLSAPKAPGLSSQPGRRKSVRAPQRNTTASAASLIGGGAFLVTVLGAATTGHAISSDSSEATPSAARHDGAYVTRLSTTAVQGRNEFQISRSAIRPSLNLSMSKNDNRLTAAREQAAARKQRLATAADDAETYADELSRAERKAARQAERKAERQAARQAERQAARQAEREAAREAAENDTSTTTTTTTPTAPVISGGWVLPTSSYSISTWYGEAGPYWSSGYHTGVDFAAAYGTPVVATTNATVVQTGWDGAYGNQIRIQIENGDQIWYNHLSSIEVTVGQTVSTGTPIGRVGDTGNSYGAHLHLEYRLASNLGSGVDPVPYFSSHGIGF